MQAIQELPGTTSTINHLVGAAAALSYQPPRRNLAAPRPGQAESFMANFSASEGVTVYARAVCGTNRQRAACRSRLSTLRSYFIATGMALGLLAVWAALLPFVA